MFKDVATRRRAAKLNLFNSAIDVTEQRKLTPVKVFLQAEVGIGANPVFRA
jgi:hypothetical protein